MKIYYLLLIALMIACTNCSKPKTDPYLWLEEVDNPKALEWVGEWNAKSVEEFTEFADYQQIYDENLKILNSSERIADPKILGDFIYNFWQDEQHQRGIWRRMHLENYLNGDSEWEILLDLDAISQKDGVKWVFKNATALYPDFNKFMVSLSKGGGDAVEIKEFDAIARQFVENGFFLPEAKGDAFWIDENTLMVSTDFGEGVTTSGYPMQVKIWKRGTELADAHEIFRGEQEDMGIWGYVFPKENKVYQLIMQRTSFYSGKHYFVENGELVQPDLPADINFKAIFKGQVIFQLKSDWQIDSGNFSSGSVVSIGYDDLLTGKKNFQLLVKPDERSAITSISTTKDRILVNMLENVSSALYSYHFDGQWVREKFEIPGTGTVNIGSATEFSNKFFFYFQNFLQPNTLCFGDSETGESAVLKTLSSWFPTENYEVKQFEATSKDGTKIPYFVVHDKSMKLDGSNPVLLYAYGGFEIPQLPRYSAITGASWLEAGGVYVLANLRGGGEFGPGWHQAGLKENRQLVYDDFHAVAEDIITKKITSPQKLGIYGGSNGGLLVGVAFTQRPDLYRAVVCAVPLLDMQRYNKLLAGASWMAEYGNPDIPEEWAYISKYSPYHNLRKGEEYPVVFFTTSTRDDRVHPGHARKMVAKMHDMGYPVLYYENTEGGHAGASTNEQRATMNAQIYTYLRMMLME